MRKFRLRNNAIVEEWGDGPTSGIKDENGYTVDYKVLDFGDISPDSQEVIKRNDGWLCLAFAPAGPPLGGSWGPNFDIVEEL